MVSFPELALVSVLVCKREEERGVFWQGGGGKREVVDTKGKVSSNEGREGQIQGVSEQTSGPARELKRSTTTR